MLFCVDKVCSVGDIFSSFLDIKLFWGNVEFVGKVELD